MAFVGISFVWQVSEKKLKNVSNLNVDPSVRHGNGNLVGSSPVQSPKGYAPPRSINGGAVRRTLPPISSDFVFPPGGIPSLHLPTVVVTGFTPYVRSVDTAEIRTLKFSSLDTFLD